MRADAALAILFTPSPDSNSSYFNYGQPVLGAGTVVDTADGLPDQIPNQFLQADEAGTPVPIVVADAGDRSEQGVSGLDVVTFPAR
jgi:hypothetical protein